MTDLEEVPVDPPKYKDVEVFPGIIRKHPIEFPDPTPVPKETE